jgi:hypothetical protein
MSSKRMRVVLSSLEEQGCNVQPTRSGWMIRFPDGVESMTLHRTESDWRSEKNTRSRVIRAGLIWPFDKK